MGMVACAHSLRPGCGAPQWDCRDASCSLHSHVTYALHTVSLPTASLGAVAPSFDPASGVPFVAVEDRWVQCDSCQKWRRVTDEKADVSGDRWFCNLNTWDPARANCEAEEENSEDDDVAQAALKAQQAAAAAAEAAAAKRAAKPAPKRRKKKGSDSEEESSGADSADEAFFLAIGDDAAAGGRSRRSGRATQVPAAYADYVDHMSEDESGKAKRPTRAPPASWTPDADDALLSAIVKHGVGSWTAMVQDPEFAQRFGDFKATSLRSRWRKLGTSNFDNGGVAGGVKLPTKKEKMQQQQQQQQLQQQHQVHQQVHAPPQQPGVPVIHRAPMHAHPSHPSGPLPNTTPFISYRPYPSHVFDLPRSAKAKTDAVVTAKDAADQLSTPMEIATSNRPKRRGRKPKNRGGSDESDFAADSDDSDAAEERAAAPEGARDDEFADLDENLDNQAYMYYYDHRNASMQLYDTFTVPMRDLKKQLCSQYQMKVQDALELMKQLGESRDLYSRRNTLAKAINAHITHFQSAQLVRQWCHAVRQMTTQHVHAQHDLKLKQEQHSRVLEEGARRAYQQAHGVPMPRTHPDEIDDNGATPHGLNPKTGEAYVRGPYLKKESAPIHTPVKPPPAPRVPPPPATPGLAALERLPYYWRQKIHAAKKSGSPFPEVTGSTPSRAVLQENLDAIKAEWNLPAMSNAILSMRVGEKGAEKSATAAPPTPQPAAAAAALPQIPSSAQSVADVQAAQAVPVPVPAMMAGVAVGVATPAAAVAALPHASPVASVKTEDGIAATGSGRKRRASSKPQRYNEDSEEGDDDARPGDDQEMDDDGDAADDEPPVPSLKLKKIASGQYALNNQSAAPEESVVKSESTSMTDA